MEQMWDFLRSVSVHFGSASVIKRPKKRTKNKEKKRKKKKEKKNLITSTIKKKYLTNFNSSEENLYINH